MQSNNQFESVKTFLSDLNALGIFLYVYAGKLKSKSTASALTAEIGTRIGAMKEQIIAYLSSLDNAVGQIEPVQRGGALTTSYAQKRLWFVDSLEQQSTHYHNIVALDVRGALDVAALQDSLNELIARHEILHSVYRMHEGELCQFIEPNRELTLKEVWVDATSESIVQLILQESDVHFDLSRDLLLKCVLAHHDQEHKTLIIIQHHITSDGRSADILVGELGALYRARINQTSPELPSLQLQYADYAAWQVLPQNKKVVNESLEYWREKLQNLPQVHSLNLCYNRPVQRTFDGTSLTHSFDENIVKGVKNLCSKLSVTPFMLLNSVFAALLSRYSNHRDIVVGTPVSGRNIQCQGMLGLFINSIVLRFDVDKTASFEHFVAQNKTMIAEALSHAEAPFERVVETVNPERSSSHEPLFQIQFSYENIDGRTLSLPGLQIHVCDIQAKVSRFDLELAIVEQAGGLRAVWTYNLNLFKQEHIASLVKHFEHLLRGVIGDSNCSIDAYPLMDAELLAELSTKTQPSPNFTQACESSATLHGLFVSSVRKTPEAIAVCDEKGSLSYRALFDSVSALATQLKPLIEPEELVAVRLPKGREQVIATLGVMMAGGAYLPVEVDWPQARCAGIFEQAGCRILICQSDADEFAEIEHRIDIAQLLPAATSQFEHWQDDVHPQHLAYVIFTSGSTGKPKGVAIEHQMAVNTILDINKRFDVTADDAVLVVSALSFDLSVYDIFGLLACGGRVVFPEHAQAKEPSHWLDCIERFGVTIWDTVPVSAAMLVDRLALRDRPCSVQVRHILMSGDWVPPTLPPRLQKYFVGVQAHSLGGATEGSIWSIHYPIVQDTSEWSGIPYGKPLTNQQFYILNEAMVPCPVGVDGELFIGGKGVAREYYHAEQLTRERFVVHPKSGERLYRTGDIGRYRDDGNILFVGRIDQQVKVRGYRIELGEIEVQLNKIQAVKKAIVRICGAGELARITAYVQPETGYIALREAASEKTFFGQLKSELGKVLADYMLPSVFITVEEFPLTANGKVDFKALPSVGSESEAEGHYVAPQTPLQQRLCEIFSTALGMENIGIEDDFFACGGHSLLASKIVTEVCTEIGAEIPLRALFENPTIERFSHYIANANHQVKGVGIAKLANTDTKVPSFAQTRMWFDEQLDSRSCKYNMSAAFEFKGNLDIERLTAAFNALIERHEVLRSTFAIRAGELTVDIQQRFGVDIEFEDISSLAPSLQQAQLKLLARTHVMTPFDLSKDLLLAAKIVRLGAACHVLLIRIHHIAADGLSVETLTNEVIGYYCEQMKPEPLAVNYYDYAAWQKEQLVEAKVDEHVLFWRRYLANAPKIHNLPLIAGRPARQSFAATSSYFTLDEALCEKLRGFCVQHKVTLFSLLQTAFGLLISRYSQGRDVVIGTPVNGRDELQLSNLVGLFLNLLPIRTRIDPKLSLEQLLAQNNRNILDAFEYHQLPFEHIVEALEIEPSLSHNPLCQIKFVLQNYQTGSLTIPEMEVRALQLDNEVTRFDLDLTAMEDGKAITLEWTFKNELFSPALIENMVRAYHAILVSFIDHAEKPLESLEVENELSANRGPICKTDRDLSVIELFAKAARDFPDDTAISDVEGEYTFAIVAERSIRLATALNQMEIGEGHKVAILSTRKAPMLISMLAVMRCGACYIPIEPGLNQARIEAILQDAGVDVMLLEESYAEQFVFPGVDYFTLDNCFSEDWFDEFSDESLDIGYPALDDAAYVIYTSGSTGLPKGVEIPHSALADYCIYARDNYYNASLAGSFVVTSHGFDITVPSLFVPLIAGNEVRLAKPQTELEQLANYLANPRSRPVLIRLTPMHVVALNLLLADKDVVDTPHVFVIGGEQLFFNTAAKLRDKLPAAIMYNHYGPSEATVGCLIYPITQVSGLSNNRVPIGRPMENTVCLVVDEEGQAVLQGSQGELWIGGPCLAKGYINQIELTAEKFPVRDGVRYYKTGDLVVVTEDGNFVFITRKDNQVSIDGFRIELNDVLAHLTTCPGIENAAVHVKEINERRRLLAHVVAEKGAFKDEQELNAEITKLLKQKLPKYMLPWAIVQVSQIPTNQNGKTDYQALPLPQVDLRSTARVVPKNDLEHQLHNVFAKVLGRSEISCEDSFFTLGGDSIMAIQVVAEGVKLGLTFSLQALFDNPTVAALAGVVNTSGGKKQEPQRSNGKAAMLPMQKLFFARGLPNQHHYNQSVLLTVPETLSFVQLKQVVACLLSTHDSLRQYVADDEIGFFDNEDTLLERAVSCAPFTQMANVIEQLQQSFVFSNPPLFRVCLFEHDGKAQRLFIVMHHLLVDGVSWRVVLDDLNSLYEQLQQSEPLMLPPQSLSLQQWSELVERHSQTQEFETERHYWLQQMSKVVDHWPSSVLVKNNETVALPLELHFELDNINTAELIEQANLAYRTNVQELLLTATLLALHQWTNRKRFLFYLESHGRETLKNITPGRLLGWLTAYYPMRFDYSICENAGDAIKLVKESAREIPSNGLGYGLLLNQGFEAEDSSKQQMAIEFNYLGQFDASFSEHSVFGVAEESRGQERCATQKQRNPIYISAMLIDGQLKFSVSFDTGIIEPNAAAEFMNRLRKQIEYVSRHCLMVLDLKNTGHNQDIPVKQEVQEIEEFTI